MNTRVRDRSGEITSIDEIRAALRGGKKVMEAQFRLTQGDQEFPDRLEDIIGVVAKRESHAVGERPADAVPVLGDLAAGYLGHVVIAQHEQHLLGVRRVQPGRPEHHGHEYAGLKGLLAHELVLEVDEDFYGGVPYFLGPQGEGNGDGGPRVYIDRLLVIAREAGRLPPDEHPPGPRITLVGDLHGELYVASYRDLRGADFGRPEDDHGQQLFPELEGGVFNGH